jgi:hypothetical protein
MIRQDINKQCSRLAPIAIAQRKGEETRRSTQKSPWTERTALVLISVADLILNKRNQKMCIIATPFQRRNALLIFAFFFMGGRCSALDLTLTENAVIA